METNSLNKTPQELKEMYQTLRDAIRNYVSRVLADNDGKLEVNASLEFGACGISSLEMPNVFYIYQDNDGSGMIWCDTDWSDEYVDFDQLYTEDQLDIVKNINIK